MAWRVATSLLVLRDEVNAAWPERSKVSDGTIGNAAHAARTSDHNPYIIDKDGVGVVRALDITHDPEHGCDARDLAERFRVMGKAGDPRVRYVINSRRIASGTPKPGFPPWSWRPYDGPNAHLHHVHLSVVEDPAGYDSAAAWGVQPVRRQPDKEPTTPGGDVAGKEVWDYEIPDPVATGQEPVPARQLLGYTRRHTRILIDLVQQLAQKVDALADQVAALAEKKAQQ